MPDQPKESLLVEYDALMREGDDPHGHNPARMTEIEVTIRETFGLHLYRDYEAEEQFEEPFVYYAAYDNTSEERTYLREVAAFERGRVYAHKIAPKMDIPHFEADTLDAIETDERHLRSTQERVAGSAEKQLAFHQGMLAAIREVQEETG
jgi:hypothetical protein